MKKGLLTKALSLLLCLLMLVPVFASCKEEETPAPETSADSTPTTQAPPAEEKFDIEKIISSGEYKIVVNEGATDYVIVYPAGAEMEKAVAESLAAKLETDTGAAIAVKDDTAAEVEKEILIGNTNRTADDKLLDGVKANDYIVKASGSKLLIGAYNVDCYELAWKRAMIAFNVTEVDEKYYAYFKNDYSYQRNGDYTVDDLTVDGNSISKYVVVYGDDFEKAIAESVQLMIQETCGYVLPIKKSALASEAAEFEILVGSHTGRVASQLQTTNTYEFKSIGKLLVFYFTNDRSGKTAVMGYTDALEALVKDGTTEIKTISITGAMSNANAGEVILSQNFSAVSGANVDEVLASAGINVLYTNTWSSSPAKFAEISNGALKLNGGGTAYEIVSENKLVGVDSLTLQFDLKVESLGVMEVLFSKTHVVSNNLEASSVMFRDYPTADSNAAYNSPSKGNGQNLGYLTQIVTSSGKVDIGPKQTNIGGTSAFNKTYKVVIEMIIGESISVSIFDGTTQVGTTRTITKDNGTIVDSVTSISIRLEKSPITIDNVILSNGSYVDYKMANN